MDEEIINILSLAEEEDDGNVEYKRSLLRKDENRICRLNTQLLFRLGEGKGECRYCIGIEDDGAFYGLNDEEHEETLNILKAIAKKNDCSICVLQTIVKKGKKYEFLANDFAFKKVTNELFLWDSKRHRKLASTIALKVEKD